MAKNLRYGKTPLWGTIKGDESVIIDSFNISHEVKDYEQTNERGGVCGYLIYDRTASFDISGTILHSGGGIVECNRPVYDFTIGKMTSCGENKVFPAIETAIRNLAYIGVSGNSDTFSQESGEKDIILKNYSVSTSAGGAATFNASGTIYKFDWQMSN